MDKIYCVGTDKLLNSLPEEKRREVEFVTSVYNVPENATLLSLHSADTVSQVASDSKKALERGIDFIGCDENIGASFNDKGKTKTLLGGLGFPVAKGIPTKGSKEMIEESIKTYNLTFPILVKEVNNTGGLGITVLKSMEDINKLDLSPLLDYVIEEFIQGEEYSCMLFVYNGKVIIFPPIIKGETGIDDKGQVIHALQKLRTNITDTETSGKVRYLSQKIGEIKGVNGFVDFDFILTKSGEIKILEVNPRTSGITEISFLGSNFGMSDIVDFITNKNDIEGSCNLINSKIVVEYPIVFEIPDFVEKKFDNIEGGKIIKISLLRKFPPYTQKLLIEFNDKESYNNFISKNK